jgi:hypothetical protein
MAPPTFVQQSRLGNAIFQIRDGALHVSVSRFTGGFDEHRVDLRKLSPNYEPQSVRLNFALGLSGLFLVLCCFALWGLYRQTVIPLEAISYFTQWPVYGIALSLILAVKYSSRVEYFQFCDNWGKPVFIVVRERRQAAECEAFVLSLVSHIEMAQSGLPVVEREALLRKLSAELSSLPAVDHSVAYWKLSLVLGSLAVGFPWIPGLAYYLDLFHFMLIFFLCAGGAVCAVFSYEKKEPGRHWSVLGLLLSLIPPFFY